MQNNKIIIRNTLNEAQREQAIKYIFTCLQATYGNSFVNNFKSGVNDNNGADTGLKTAQKFWRKKLDVFFNTTEGRDAIHQALDNLPTYPPNLIQFFESVKIYCRQNIQKQHQATFMQDLAQGLTAEEREQNKRKVQALLGHLKNMFQK